MVRLERVADQRSARPLTRAERVLRCRVPELPRIRVIDSHTGGEPTRVVVEGGLDLGTGPLAERAARFGAEFDRYRSAIVNEPRGSDPVVGALLVPPHEDGCRFGVIFFNNIGVIGMCGHGTIGLVETLAHLGSIGAGTIRIDTPVGPVEATRLADGDVTIANVPSRRTRKDIVVTMPGGGEVRGDVAWGGNWFFLVKDHGFELALGNLRALDDYARQVRRALDEQGFPEIDHVELFGPPQTAGAQSRNFVLCPGGAYDRSPCGTGTSAKLACLAADGALAEGEPWVQESVIGSRFTGRFAWLDPAEGLVRPSITGRAYITSEASLVLDPADPFCWGIR